MSDVIVPLTPDEVVKVWTTALRSGDYTQTTERLQGYTGFCCLGVLCEIAEEHGVEVHRDHYGFLEGTTLEQQTAVKAWAGLESLQGLLPSTNSKYNFLDPSLTTLNDDGSDFNEIADTIEKFKDYLFR